MSVLKTYPHTYSMLHIICSLYSTVNLKGLPLSSHGCIYWVKSFQRAMCYEIGNHFDAEILICTLVTIYW